MHLRYAFRYVHLRLHPVCSLHPHYVSSKWDLGASGIVVQAGSHISQDAIFQPHSLGQGSITDGDKVCPQIYPAWYPSHFVYCNSVAVLGGIASMVVPLYVRWYLHLTYCSLSGARKAHLH